MADDDGDGPSAALLALLNPLCSDAWVQCDSCEKWRRVPKEVSERLGEDEQWCVPSPPRALGRPSRAPRKISWRHGTATSLSSRPSETDAAQSPHRGSLTAQQARERIRQRYNSLSNALRSA